MNETARDIARALLREVADLLREPERPPPKPFATLRDKRDAHRFWSKVRKGAPDQCWLWTGLKTRGGYGIFSVGGRSVLAHRYTYERSYGPIPAGLAIMHRCDKPACINARHLSAGTPRDNCRDKIVKKRHAYGERHPNARLTFAAVREIRVSGETQIALARRFGVSTATIRNIQNGTSWKLVDEQTGLGNGRAEDWRAGRARV